MPSLPVSPAHSMPCLTLGVPHNGFVRAKVNIVWKSQPVDVGLFSVLSLFNLIPPFYEMLDNVKYTRTRKRHVYVVPRHPRTFQKRKLVRSIVADVLEIHDPSIVKVLPREESVRERGRMNISKRMVVRVPSAKAEIQTADTGKVVVNDDDLFVVRPEFDRVLGTNVVWVTDTLDVGVQIGESPLEECEYE